MAILRNDPFRELYELQDQLFRTFDTARRREAGGKEELALAAWTPAADIYEDEHAFTLKLELPEVEMKDVDIRVDGNQLTVRGERKLEREQARDGYHRIERSYGTFARTFTLPDAVDVDHIGAESKDGVLRLVLPKKAESKPRQIKVQVAGAIPGAGGTTHKA